MDFPLVERVNLFEIPFLLSFSLYKALNGGARWRVSIGAETSPLSLPIEEIYQMAGFNSVFIEENRLPWRCALVIEFPPEILLCVADFLFTINPNPPSQTFPAHLYWINPQRPQLEIRNVPLALYKRDWYFVTRRIQKGLLTNLRLQYF